MSTSDIYAAGHAVAMATVTSQVYRKDSNPAIDIAVTYTVKKKKKIKRPCYYYASSSRWIAPCSCACMSMRAHLIYPFLFYVYIYTSIDINTHAITTH